MGTHGPKDFARPAPVLPPGVAVCDRIPRSKWYLKAVTIRNNEGVDVAKALCQNLDQAAEGDVRGHVEGEPLGDDRIFVQIAESLCEAELPSEWMWSIHLWDIRHVILDGISLYDHHQTNLYNMAMKALKQRGRKGIRSYETMRARVERAVPPKKEALLATEAIVTVSTQSCCEQNCLQPFPRGQIHDICSQLHVNDGVYSRKKCLLEVHRQIHKDCAGKEWITLKGREVCPTAWWTIHGISKATFYRYKDMAKSGKQAEVHGNVGLKKPRLHTVQATATLRTLIVSDADRMPHRSKTLESGEKVPAMVLPSAFRWSDQLSHINEVNAAFELQPISSTGLSNIRRASFPEYAAKARGDSFSRCGLCDKYKQLRSACTPLSYAQEKWTHTLEDHLTSARAHRELYYFNRTLSEDMPAKMLTIIHDKMDHSKTASPHYSYKTKATDSYIRMPVAVTGMIAHGHGDVKYAHYGLDTFATNSNHTIGSMAKLLRDLEEPPKNSSRKLFSEENTHSMLTKAVLKGSDICLDSLLPLPEVAIPAEPLPPILVLQLDNASGDNKNRWVFAFCSLLVYKGIFREVYINFLIVGHTHEDIDAMFGRWSTKLKANNYPTIPRLMKSFMDCETHPVIPHFIEEVPDFKEFVDGYLGEDGDFLEGHSSSQQFKFYMDSDGWPLMEYKILCTDKKWLPLHGKGIRLWSESEDGRPRVPNGEPFPVDSRKMGSLDEIQKGLNGFIAHWSGMANDDLSGEFRRKNDPLKDYWKDVRSALDAALEPRERLLHGFWPTSRIVHDEADHRQRDGTLQEEDAEDEPFVGRRRDRPRALFRVTRDTYAGYFVALRPAADDPRPLWLARAITNPSPDPSHLRMIQIQYWKPTSGRNINMETYEGWDTKKGNSWCEDRDLEPTWLATSSLMTAWKPRFREGTVDPKVAIPVAQINIIKQTVEAFPSDSEEDADTAE